MLQGSWIHLEGQQFLIFEVTAWRKLINLNELFFRQMKPFQNIALISLLIFFYWSC